MTHPFRPWFIAAVLLTASASQSLAQNLSVPSRSLVPAAFPRWDLSGSLGLMNIAIRRNEEPWRGDWDHKLEYRADVGRYWTTHLKTEFTAGLVGKIDRLGGPVEKPTRRPVVPFRRPGC